MNLDFHSSRHAASGRRPRTAWAGLSLLALFTLSACGGGGSSNASSTPAVTHYEVVSFGDSLSDAGTYAPAASRLGGGRFTTNPGQVWTQDVANFYGGTLNAAFTGGFGQALVAQSGLDYAQGGSRVTNPVGVGNALTNTPPGGATDQATTVPVVTQLQNYLSAHHSFNAGQLVLVEAGANDIIFNAQAAALANGAITPAMTQAAVQQAALDLTALIGQMLKNGATHLVVADLPNLGGTPLGVASALNTQTFTGLTQLFNGTLKAALAGAGLLNQVTYVDAYTWSNSITAAYQANGFTVSNTGTACNLAAMGASNGGLYASSLFCSPETLTVPGADQTYMYADTVHPTTHLHALFANYVEQRVAQGPSGN